MTYEVSDAIELKTLEPLCLNCDRQGKSNCMKHTDTATSNHYGVTYWEKTFGCPVCYEAMKVKYAFEEQGASKGRSGHHRSHTGMGERAHGTV